MCRKSLAAVGGHDLGLVQSKRLTADLEVIKGVAQRGT
jgi:hypothetical protein